MTSRFTAFQTVSLTLFLSSSGAVMAQQASDEDSEIATVTVTGSLIPQRTDIETAAPITVISAEDLQVRGFTSVADAVQQASFSNGAVQGAQYSGGFTQGAKTLSLFGLSPSYVKYLIDGRPMIDYPALYNGTDIITNISGIPMELVDHIDILPGGQSSIYGSDAIAGVVNIVMKKKIEGTILNANYQTYQDGGGRDRRITAATGFSAGSANFVAGLEYGKLDPIWGYQRSLTDHYFDKGQTAQVAERDFLILGNFSGAYVYEGPADCAGLTNGFNNSIRFETRAGRGDYCGTRNAGYYTIQNGADQLNGYLHGTLDVNDSMSFYTDILASHEKVRYNTGTRFITSDGLPEGGFYDPNFDDFMTMQHIFSPEEEGGLYNNMDRNITKAYSATFGATGPIMSSAWTYDVGFTAAQQRLTEHSNILLTDPVLAYLDPILGPSQGLDPYFGAYQTYTPNYAAFYDQFTPEEFAGLRGDTTSKSKTTDTMIRAQLTNPALFSMPAGDAGLALVAEWGRQKWNYDPDERLTNGEAFLFTATAGEGKRSRYAVTGELRVPVLKPLTFTASGRYDAYRVSGETIDKATYMAGLELRPIQQLMLRGRYGTAFKAPTLSEEFQGLSGFFQSVVDYYACAQDGQPLDTSCTFYNSYFGQTRGNPELKPINAKVWDVGVVFAPTPKLSLTADLLHWNIDNEVGQLDSDKLLRDEYECRSGIQDPASSNCVEALSLVNRSGGFLISFVTPKFNVANEKLTALTMSAAFSQDIGRFGSLDMRASWNNMMDHKYQQNADSPVLNLLTNPYWSTEFRNSVNASVTWNIAKASTTLYMNMRGKAPNWYATDDPDGYLREGAGKLKAWTIFDLNFGYELTDHINLSATVDNLFDKAPPKDYSYLGTEVQPYNEFNYNVYGRSYIFEMAYRFGK